MYMIPATYAIVSEKIIAGTLSLPIELPEFSSVLVLFCTPARERNALKRIKIESKSIMPHRNLGNCEDFNGYVKLVIRRSREITVIDIAKNNSLDVFFIENNFTPELDPPLKSGGSQYLYRSVNY